MTDKELLIAAAKAAGVPEPWSHDKLAAFQFDATYWNPLVEDGDALRLAVKLGIDVDQNDDRVIAWSSENYVELHNGDPCAATRRAITRAAAALAPQGVE